VTRAPDVELAASALGQNRTLEIGDNVTDSPKQKAPPLQWRIGLIHATALAMAPIADAFQRHWPQAQCMNLLDDSLSRDHAQNAGVLTEVMTKRFVTLANYAKGTGCEAILFTCSAFGPAIEAAGAACGLPTFKPNEAMFEDALALAAKTSNIKGAKLGLIATFEASLPPMTAELQAMAQARGRSIQVQTVFVPEAMQDLAGGRAEMHHDKVAKAAQALNDCDVVMLAQFSMAAALPFVQAKLPCHVLSSPDCAVLALKRAIFMPNTAVAQ
jgi:hypothetical protein